MAVDSSTDVATPHSSKVAIPVWVISPAKIILVMFLIFYVCANSCYFRSFVEVLQPKLWGSANDGLRFELQVLRRYFSNMERRKWLAVKEYNAQRPAYYEDHAKPAWISAPVMAVAAAALLIGGHFLSRRGGRRTGGDGGNQGGTASTRNSSNKDSPEPRGILPLNLAELRAKRAAAAEARLPKEGSSNASSALTPLGSILMLARKVDKLEEECSAFLSNVGSSTTMNPAQHKELAQLLELLTQLQLKIDGVKADETVRPHRKVQTTRVQSLLSALEKLSSESGQ